VLSLALYHPTTCLRPSQYSRQALSSREYNPAACHPLRISSTSSSAAKGPPKRMSLIVLHCVDSPSPVRPCLGQTVLLHASRGDKSPCRILSHESIQTYLAYCTQTVPSGLCCHSFFAPSCLIPPRLLTEPTCTVSQPRARQSYTSCSSRNQRPRPPVLPPSRASANSLQHQLPQPATKHFVDHDSSW